MPRFVTSAFRRESAEFDRGLSFFDAVYGFAITLLIANIDPPSAEQWRDVHTLLDGTLGTQLVGFVISFIVIAIFWRENFTLIARLTGVDSAVVAANLVTVGLVVFIPFTTQGISDPETTSLALPTVVYAINIALAIVSQMVMYEIARRHGLVAVEQPRTMLWVDRVDGFVKAAVFLASVPVALSVDADTAKWVWASLVVLAPLTALWSRRATARIRADGEAVG